MTADAFRQIIAAPARDRLDLFMTTANRLGTPVGNVEKDFWVSWTLDVLYHRLPADGPRLLFKGGTSLSKGYGLIKRFSEDIDVTVFRDDLSQPASIEDLQKLSKNKRRARLDAIRDACRDYITGAFRNALAAALAKDTGGVGRIEVDADDPDGQTLLVWYPEVEPQEGAYVRPAVRIESGAKSALDPNQATLIRPYIADDAPAFDLAVSGVTTIEPGRTFWDKVVIVHGLRRWYERHSVLRQEGQRVSRHYYDLHCLINTGTGHEAVADLALGADCVAHAMMFFNRTDYDLASAAPGTFAIVPVAGMVDALRRDYANTAAMIFGAVPAFDDILASIETLDAAANMVAMPTG
jgi:hypothetical protein